MYLSRILESIMDGDSERTENLTRMALKCNMPPDEIVEKALIPAINDIGSKFYTDELFIPAILVSSRAVQASLRILKKDGYVLRRKKNFHKKNIKVLIGTVAGDIHDIGKNIISMLMEAKGYEVIDAGIDVTPEDFLDHIQKYKPDVLALSALLTSTMISMRHTIKLLAEKDLRASVRIMVGGGPVTKEFAQIIGADAYTDDAISAVAWLDAYYATTMDII